MKTHWKSCAIGAAVAAALLGATACEPGASDAAGTGTPSAPPSATGAPTPTVSAQPGGTSAPKPSGTSANPGGNGGSGDGGGSGGTVAACTAEDLGVSSRKEPADSKEARHLLLTVQNAGGEKCVLYRFPYVRIGADARTTVPVIKDSDPDPGRPVTLAPGEEAHVALLVAGGHRDEYQAKSITLTLQGSKAGSRASKPIDVPLPVATLYADDGQLVTYWTTAEGMALDFIMSK
ncbi:DUF4232 domain-containing protein [Streptomyces sp. NPDC056069]|uniref:DUF4232 domain-containing protein n=1 Tax=Streptomyces sp. NPDC056069 TaxID=3345702 RepID=UPI0035DE74EF